MPNYYPDEAAGAGPPNAAPNKPPMNPKEGEEPETSLVPLSVFPNGVKPGDKFTGTVVHLYEDEAEVSIEASSEEKPETQEPSTMPADDELDSLAKE